MRYYPTEDYEKEEFEILKAEPWMAECLKMNPDYLGWGNYEDYMACSDSGWDKPVELESIKDMWKLDDLNEVINFYFEIERKSHECTTCEGIGYNAETMLISEDWYSGERWMESLTQDEVDVLWENGRLRNFRKKPTAKQVNSMAKKEFIHDSLNQMICVEQRAKRLGVYGFCSECDGIGRIFDEEKAHLELQLWVIHPRKGCSRGVRIKNINKDDLPEAVALLQEARKRNDNRFSKLELR